MKSRLIFCDIWEDPDISPDAKHLYAYCWTNDRANLIGLYKTSNAYTTLDTGLDEMQIEDSKRELQEAKRVFFFENWIYLPDSQERCGYTNKLKHKKEIDRQTAQTPDGVIKYFRSLGYNIPYQWPTDSNIKQKPETRKNKTEFINQKEEEIDLDEIEI